MKIVNFSPLEQMDSLRSQIDRVFASIEDVPQDNYSAWKPTVELLDDSDNLILRMALAGINRQDIDVEVTRESVTVSGEHHRPEIESSHYLYSELNYGKFQRQIFLPVSVINSQARASYEDGILTLVLPKVEEAKKRVVKIALEDTASGQALAETGSSKEEAELVSA